MKIAILGDTHFGIKQDNPIIYNAYNKFFNELMFPYMKKENITTLIHLGDLVDKRKYITGITIDYIQNNFLNPLKDLNIELHMIPGNHDSVFKNTIELNYATQLIKNNYENFHVYDSITEVKIGNKQFLFVPWICKNNQLEIEKQLSISTASVCIGHFELSGFQMYKGSIAHDGMSSKLLEGFPLVLSGHYHTRSNNDNIHYLGIPFDFTWQDWNDPKGFHVLDTDSLELTFIPTNVNIHHQITYPYKGSLDPLKDGIVKIILENEYNLQEFDLFKSSLEEIVSSLKIIDMTENKSINDEEIIVSDILTVFNTALKTSEDPELNRLVTEIYTEALSLI